ncbi:MAG TPA: hypothetical protein VLF89_06090 [Candidatus Saccharimonadales bacterium]|nr:hypothetical protein [Candidatus Saccharimonadales bacterium]
MKSKNIIIIAMIGIIFIFAAYGYRVYHRKQLQEAFRRSAEAGQHESIGYGENEIPQNGDLCSGTGGIGQIISVGKNNITIKLHDSRNQIITLPSMATIKTSSGSAVASDLKRGERVTLVGGPNSDGSFTADTVVVCKGN